MKRIFFPGVLIILLVLSSCAPALRVYQDQDKSVNFQTYKTFSFNDWTEGNKKTITGMELDRIRNAVEAELEAKGLQYQEQGGQLNVSVTVFHREATQSSTYPYGMYYYYPPMYGRTYHYIERAITVDLYDAATDHQVWHSAVVGALERNAERRAEDLPRAAAKLLKDYPGDSQI